MLFSYVCVFLATDSPLPSSTSEGAKVTAAWELLLQTTSPRIKDSSNQIAGNTRTATAPIPLDKITRPMSNQIARDRFPSIDMTGGLDAFLMLRSNVGVATGVKRSMNTEPEGAPHSKKG